MKRLLLPLLAVTVILLTILSSCKGEKGTPVLEPPAVPEALTPVDPEPEPPRETIEEEAAPLPPKVPDEKAVTSSWEEFDTFYDSGDNKIVYYFKADKYNIPFIEGAPLKYQGEPQGIIGDPHDEKVIYIDFVFKHPDTEIKIYNVTNQTGGKYYTGGAPSPVVGEEVFSQVVKEGRLLLQLGGFIDYDVAPSRFVFPYKIEIASGDEKGSFYAAYYTNHDLEATENLKGFGSLREELAATGNLPTPTENGPSPIKEEPPATVTTPIENAPLPKDFSFISLNRNSYITDKDIYTAINKISTELGMDFKPTIRTAFSDNHQNIYYKISNGKNQDVFILKLDAQSGLFELHSIISEDYKADNTLVKLPLYNYYLKHGGQEGTYLQAPLEGAAPHSAKGDVPEAGQNISWMGDPIINPHNINEEIWLGRVLNDKSDYSMGIDTTDQYIVLLRSGNGVEKWFLTHKFSVNSAYIEKHFSVIVTGSSQSDFMEAMAYTSSFEPFQVRAYYPDSSSTLTFDFINLEIESFTQYTEALKESYYNTLVTSTPDGRYEIWKVNERRVHEGGYYEYILFDNDLDQGYDFYSHLPDNSYPFYRLSFIGNNQLAVLHHTPLKEEEEITREGKESFSSVSRVLLFDLSTKALVSNYQFYTPENITVTENYLWNYYTGRHVLLGRIAHGPYSILEYDTAGNLVYEHLTTIGSFGKIFTYDPSIFQLLDSSLYLIYNPFKPFSYHFVDTIEEAVESELLLSENTNTMDIIANALLELNKPQSVCDSNTKEQISALFRTQIGHMEDGRAVFRYIADTLPTNSDNTIYRLEGQDIIVVKNSIYSLITFGETGFKVEHLFPDFPIVLSGFKLYQAEDALFIVVLTEDSEKEFYYLDFYQIFEGGTIEKASTKLFALNISNSVNIYGNKIRLSQQLFTNLSFRVTGDGILLSYDFHHLNERVDTFRVLFREGLFEICSV